MPVQQRGLKNYLDNPKNACSLARQMFYSTNVRTVVVEGDNDKRFFGQWLSGCKFHVCNGKNAVINVYKHYREFHRKDAEFMCFVVDLDFDEVLSKDLIEDECFIYNSFCSNMVFNDMEVFLVNTPAFEKVLSNFDLDAERAGDIRQKLREASSILGSFRAADFFVQRDNKLSGSVLNGLELRRYFDEAQIFVDPDSVNDGIRLYSGYNRLYSDDLIGMAARLRNKYPNSWRLSRGHDVTEMLSLFLGRVKKKSDIDNLERMLRLACERSYFEAGPVGKRFCSMGLL